MVIRKRGSPLRTAHIKKKYFESNDLDYPWLPWVTTTGTWLVDLIINHVLSCLIILDRTYKLTSLDYILD